MNKYVLIRKLRVTPPFGCQKLARLKHIGLQQPLMIDGVVYETDKWTNVTSKVLSYVGRNVHLEKHNPLNLVSRRVVDYFYKRFTNSRGNPLFSVHDRLSPVVTTEQNFDSLLVPKNHPSRSASDTYYVNEGHVLRAHTSAHQWDFIGAGLNDFLVIGDVYRRDSIDYCHYPVFHQIEGVRLRTKQQLASKASSGDIILLFEDGVRTEKKQAVHTAQGVDLMEREMKATIEGLAEALFGDQVVCRWVEAYFPFTHPSWELEIYHKDEWLEVLGCGIMEHSLLDSAGAGDKIGWAVGFGLERLAMKLYSIPDIRLFWSTDSGFLSQFNVTNINEQVTYKRVSAYPQCINDISFWIPQDFVSTDFYDIVRTYGGDLVEQVTLVDQFFSPKKQLHSHCYRIVYRHMEKTLTQAEVNVVHKHIEQVCVKQLNVVIR